MERRVTNTSRFDRKSKTLQWRVEWVFCSGADAAGERLTTERVSEEAPLSSALDSLLAPAGGNAVTRQRLRRFVDAGGAGACRLFLLKEPSPANAKTYYALDPAHALKTILAGKLIIEFPTVHVALEADAQRFPLVP
mmetsp:Transcript_18153/g.59299  ORF Transcript_18153/g.59299 Transcript_18153/m.59299 type:complete len:137 (+) Transcript_18153:531-941(+)